MVAATLLAARARWHSRFSCFIQRCWLLRTACPTLSQHASIGQLRCLTSLPTPVQGAIVNVSSIAAQMPMMNFSAYCVAKAASDSLTKNLVRLMRHSAQDGGEF